MAFLAIFALNFLSGVSTTLLFSLKGIPHAKHEKDLMIMPVYLLFAQHWT